MPLFAITMFGFGAQRVGLVPILLQKSKIDQPQKSRES